MPPVEDENVLDIDVDALFSDDPEDGTPEPETRPLLRRRLRPKRLASVSTK